MDEQLLHLTDLWAGPHTPAGSRSSGVKRFVAGSFWSFCSSSEQEAACGTLQLLERATFLECVAVNPLNGAQLLPATISTHLSSRLF